MTRRDEEHIPRKVLRTHIPGEKEREDDRKQDGKTYETWTWSGRGDGQGDNEKKDNQSHRPPYIGGGDVLDWERAWRWTGRQRKEGQSVTPATLYRGGGTYWTGSGRGDGQGDNEKKDNQSHRPPYIGGGGRTGLGAGVEMDRATWSRKTISHTGHPIMGGRTGLGAGVEMDRVTWSRKTISHTMPPYNGGGGTYWTGSGRGDGQGDME